MNEKINYHEKYILIVDTKENYEKFSYSFKNILLLNIKTLDKTIKFINKNSFKNIIFVNYIDLYSEFLGKLEGNHIVKVIYTYDLGTLSFDPYYQIFKKILKLYEDKKIDEIGFLDKYLYEAFKNKTKCSHILLDTKENIKVSYHDDSVSIINDPDNRYHSFYNELSGISLAKRKVRIKKYNKTLKSFLKLFNIENEKEKKEYAKSLVNLYINFSNTDILKVIKIFDEGRICILGNTYLFDSNQYLKSKLVMKSDDDINEIKDKIEEAFKCKDKILSEYKKFRKGYSVESKKSVLSFTEDYEIKEDEENDILLSVIVPVYNCGDYVASCLDSLIKARIRKMEIVVINDGSTDNSEEIILKYVKKYPKLIKYIKQKNEGIATTRTIGLKNARGKYISSVDSDDIIDKRFYKDAVKYLLDDIDLVMYDWETCTIDTKYLTPAIETFFVNKPLYQGIMYSTIMASQCNKIIKKSIYEHLNLNYGKGKYEDFATNPIALLLVRKFKYISKPYYKYQIRKGSIMRSNPGLAMIDAIKLLSDRLLIYDKYNDLPKEEFNYYLFSWRIEQYIINVLYDLDETERSKMIDYMYKKIKDVVVETFENPLYKNMIERLPLDKKEYLLERNKYLKNDKLKQFLSKKIKDKSYKTIITEEMFYL